MATKFDPTKGTSTNQKSRTPAYISGNKPKVRRPAYHHADQQTDERLVTPPTRKPGESLGQGKQESVIQKKHSDMHPTLQQKKQDNTKRVIPVPASKPQKGKQIVTRDGVNPKK
jgi:hypothetical protein